MKMLTSLYKKARMHPSSNTEQHRGTAAVQQHHIRASCTKYVQTTWNRAASAAPISAPTQFQSFLYHGSIYKSSSHCMAGQQSNHNTMRTKFQRTAQPISGKNSLLYQGPCAVCPFSTATPHVWAIRKGHSEEFTSRCPLLKRVLSQDA